jgi:hypothetical protein
VHDGVGADSSGRWFAGRGERVVHRDDASRLRATTASMSTTLSIGFVGVSTQIRRVSSRTARSSASRSVWSTMVYDSPQRASTLSTRRNVPPYRSAGRTTWSPAPQTAVSSAWVAAIPDARAVARPPSSSPSAASSAERVGFAERA